MDRHWMAIRVDRRRSGGWTCGRGTKLESVTADAFTASIQDTGASGTWSWRARGPRRGPTLTVVDGQVDIDTSTWRTTVLLPPFAGPSEITPLQPDGQAIAEPEVESVTADKFTAVIRNTDQSGSWLWRALESAWARSD
jgi:hypothetical protein